MRAVKCFGIIVGFAFSVFGQVGGTGSIQGTVTDATGAVVPQASLVARNTATGVEIDRETNKTGLYVLPLLTAGEYSVTAKAAGFQTLTRTNVVVAALSSITLDLQMQVGTAGQSMTIAADATILKTDDVSLGSSMENQVYDALPLAMNGAARDPSAFVGLALGVSNYSTQPAGPSTGSFNGGQTYQNEVYVEGLPLTSAGTEGETRNLAFGVSVEAVDQFQVETSGAKAMYEGQGVSNYVLKSGTNQFHGGVFEYFRNTIFDARGFFARTTPVEHQNEFGGSFGGPIKKNKLFFFGNYDGYRFASATPPGFQTIPTAAERLGDFSAFPQIIYDPTSASGTGLRTPFPNNTIPANRISKVAQSFQSYLPPPTNGNIQNNYLATLPNRVNNDSTTDKVDWNVVDKNRLFGLISKGKYANPIVGSLVPLTTSTLPVPYTAGRSVIEYSTLAQIHDTHLIGPSLVNQFSVSFSRLFIPLTSNTASGNYPKTAGLTGLPPGIASTGFPDITFNGNNAPVSWAGTNSRAFNEAQNTYDVQDNVLWTKGRHNVTVGFQFQALQDNLNSPLTGTQAGFTFSNNQTANFNAGGTLVATTGLSYASYLLGAVDSSVVTQNSVAETGGRYKTYATYVQDDFRVSSRLTLNLGLRWNVWTPFTEVNNVQSFFNPSLPNPLAGNIPGALQFAGDGPASCHCATPVETHKVNLGPRLGAAYRVGDKTVLRGSFGIFFVHAGGVGGRVNGRQGLSQLGFNNNGSLGSAVTGQPAYYWDNGYPGNPLNPPFFDPSYGIGFITAAAGARVGSGPTTAQTVTYGDPKYGGKPPYYENWSFNIQHSFTPNVVLTVAYSASAGHFLPGAGVAGPYTNQIPARYLPLGPLLTQTLTPATLAQAQALFPNVSVPFPNFTGTIGQALKPFPQYNGISNPWLNVANSTYNALQVSLNRRFAHGFTFMINYAFSKELDNIAGVRDPDKDYLEKAPGGIDHPHVASATFVYQLPFGAGHNWNPGNKMVNAALANWQFSGIFTFTSGSPLSITGTCVGGGIIDAVCFPNYAAGFTGSPWQNGDIGSNGANVPTTQYINKAAFTNPANYTAGNIARTAPLGLRVPHNADFDLSIRREFRLVERVRLSFQADAFNLNNAVHFAAPGTNIDTASFGIFSAMSNQPRKLQFSARVSF